MEAVRHYRLFWIPVVIVALALLSSACANQSRPSVPDWLSSWETAAGALPPLGALEQDPAPEICNQTLASLRELRPTVTNTPDMVVDGAVQEWFQIAEGAFFECPPRSEALAGFADAYAELGRLEREIEAALNISGSTSG